MSPTHHTFYLCIQPMHITQAFKLCIKFINLNAKKYISTSLCFFGKFLSYTYNLYTKIFTKKLITKLFIITSLIFIFFGTKVIYASSICRKL